MAAASVLAFIGLALVARSGGHLYESQSVSTEAGRAQDLGKQDLPRQPDRAGFVLVFSSPSLSVADPGFRSAMDQALAQLRSDSRVFSVTTPYNGGARSMISRDGRSAVASVTLDENSDQADTDYPRLRGLVHSDQLSVVATGGAALEDDFNRLTDQGLSRSQRVALPLSLLILVLAFGGIAAALLPVGVGVLAITAATAGSLVLSRYWQVSPSSPELISLLGLGLAIDYSLFVVTRFREELARGLDVGSALAATTATASRSIAFSGLTVMAGLSGLFFFQGIWLGTVAMPMVMVVAFAVGFNLTVLTAVLAILGQRVNSFHLPLPRIVEPGAFWRRLSTWVMRRPVLFLLPALGLVTVTALPLLRMNLATDHRAMLPVTAESRRGMDTIAQDFPNHKQSSNLVLVDYPSGDPLTQERVGELYDLSRRMGRLPDVVSVQGPVDLDPSLTRADYERLYAMPAAQRPLAVQDTLHQSVGRHVALMTVTSNQPAMGDRARELVRLLRQQHIATGQILIGGDTAYDMDRTAAILARAPLALGFVALMTYVVLFLLLRSVVLPLKAVLTNLLSMAASFGAIVWIFQEGKLSGLLGFTPGATDPTLPVLLFCLLFGLSMDYEVFLLTRIQEEYWRTGNNRAAVAFGLQRCGRLVTFAALIMVAVFSASALSDLVVFKAAGIGASIAVLMDATLVRGLIVPSLMVLLGRVNWWAPGWLSRLPARHPAWRLPTTPGRPLTLTVLTDSAHPSESLARQLSQGRPVA